MNSVRKIRLELDPQTAQALDGQSKITNWLYNHLLEEANKLRQQYRTNQGSEVGLVLYSERGLRDLIPELKQPLAFLKTVFSSPLKNAALRLSKAIADYQKSRKGKRKGKEVNWPRFRSWKRKWFSLQYDEPWKGYQVEGRTLKIQLGVDATGKRLAVVVQLQESLPSSDQEVVKQLRIVKEAGEFFAVFTLEKEDIVKKEITNLKIIAIDPNHKNMGYGVGSDGRGIEIAILEGLKKIDEGIDLLKSKRDKCEKHCVLSAKWRRAESEIG